MPNSTLPPYRDRTVLFAGYVTPPDYIDQARPSTVIATEPVWPTTHNMTLAEIEASICYWRGQGKSYFDACSTPGKAQASALEQLYTRLLATHQDGIYTTHLSAREHAALTAGAWKKGRLGPATDIPALRPAKTG